MSLCGYAHMKEQKCTHANARGDEYTLKSTLGGNAKNLLVLWHKAVKPKAKSLVSLRNTKLER